MNLMAPAPLAQQWKFITLAFNLMAIATCAYLLYRINNTGMSVNVLLAPAVFVVAAFFSGRQAAHLQFKPVLTVDKGVAVYQPNWLVKKQCEVTRKQQQPQVEGKYLVIQGADKQLKVPLRLLEGVPAELREQCWKAQCKA